MKGPTSAELDRLLAQARGARARAYAPYSKYRVGAAVLTGGGGIFEGCNVENATYGATICAERAAVCAMVAAGERGLRACAVVTGSLPAGTPCGICRQVLSEFAHDIPVVVAAEDESGRLVGRKTLHLSALLPFPFRKDRVVGARRPR